MNQQFNDFKERLRDGYAKEHEIEFFIKKYAIGSGDQLFMDTFNFTISDILNGRLDYNTMPIDDIRNMAERWNKAIGFEIIVTQFI